MIVWLSSYPRCGNTLLRQIFWRAWGIGTFSIYGDDPGTCDCRVPGLVGHRSFGCPFADAYERVSQCNQLYLVKTHENPIDSQKAICIVRDGRSAIRSFFHYRRDFEGCTDDAANLRDVLLGFTPFASWSDHLDNWDPLHRPGTLVVKYEDLIDNPAEPIARMADFLGVEPRRAWKNGFDELSQIEPRLFRAASANQPENALAGKDVELFWMLHGCWMRRLGYASPATASKIPELPDQFRRSLYLAIANQIARVNAAQARAERQETRENNENSRELELSI
jgi:hypothetical protein